MNRTAAHESYQQIHAHKPLFGKKNKVLNLGNFDFDIVSDFGFFVSQYDIRYTSIQNPPRTSVPPKLSTKNDLI